MHDWILKKDNYHPSKDKNSFIDQNIISMISKLSRMRREDFTEKTFLYKLNPSIKFLTTLFLVLVISLTRNFTYVLFMCSYALLNLSFVKLDEIKKIIMLCLFALGFSFIILFPSIFLGNFSNSVILCIKIFSTVIFVNVFAYTTRQYQITGVLKVFGIPDLFILVMDITIKYILVIGDVALNMFYSLKIKSIGKITNKTGSISKLIGFLFIRSKSFSEDVYSSMLCRGFNGKYVKAVYNLCIYDYIYICVNVLVIVGVFI